jgi:UDP-N-acetylglucosamine 1-carboxyvinyltransferase
MSSQIVIDGGRDVSGDIHVSGSKNAGLALMAASLLASGESVLAGVPPLLDIKNMGRILQYLGAEVSRVCDGLQIDTTNVSCCNAPSRLTRSLRASILVLGPLVARFGHAKLSLPGGCTIGGRPIEEHVNGLEKLGATVRVTEEYIEVDSTGLKGATIHLGAPSVTGTMNLVMAACLAQGVTNIHNAAREPDIVDLINCLISMGADIQGAGTAQLIIHGRDALYPFQYKVMEDRIEAGTFLILGALAGNPLTVRRCKSEYQMALIRSLRAVGARIEVSGTSITVHRAVHPRAVDMETGPYPAFPTDLQPQFMALLSLACGTSRITETVFENRFSHVAGLIAMGADISISERTALVHGVKYLSGAEVAGSDLRAGAGLVLAAVAAKGVSVIRGTQYIDRGYQNLEFKLQTVGAVVKRSICGEGADNVQSVVAIRELYSVHVPAF